MWEPELPTDPRESLRPRLATDAARPPSDEFLQQLFSTVTGKSAAVYDTAWPGCSLVVSRLAAHPRPNDQGSDEYPVTAATHHEAGSAIVELRLSPDDFGPAALAAVPALLTRECVCHVPARPVDGREIDVDQDRGIFQEGFMDWAAEFFAGRWAGLLEPDLVTPARQHGTVVLLLDRTGPSPRSHSRRVGRRAAKELAGWLRNTGGLPVDEAAASVARLAVAVNTDDSPPEYKDLAVSRLRFTPYPAELARALRDWSEHRCGATTVLRAADGDASTGYVRE